MLRAAVIAVMVVLTCGSSASGASSKLRDVGVPGAVARSAGVRYVAVAAAPGDDDSVPASVELQRCGAKPRTLKVCRAVTCGQPVIDDRTMAWVETKRRKARLVVRSLRSGRTRTTAMGVQPLTPLLVGGRLYVLAGQRLLAAAL